MKTMSNWEGFDADLKDEETRQMSVKAVEQFYNLFWKESEQIDKVLEMLEKKIGLPF